MSCWILILLNCQKAHSKLLRPLQHDFDVMSPIMKEHLEHIFLRHLIVLIFSKAELSEFLMYKQSFDLNYLLYPSKKCMHTHRHTGFHFTQTMTPENYFTAKWMCLCLSAKSYITLACFSHRTLRERHAAYATNVLCDTSTWVSGETWAWQPHRVRGGWEDGVEVREEE